MPSTTGFSAYPSRTAAKDALAICVFVSSALFLNSLLIAAARTRTDIGTPRLGYYLSGAAVLLFLVGTVLLFVDGNKPRVPPPPPAQ
jgi:hypothetical protein